MPHLANNVAFQTFVDFVTNTVRKVRPLILSDPEHPEVNELHVMLSILKPLCSKLT
jgi:hypothetical protein